MSKFSFVFCPKILSLFWAKTRDHASIFLIALLMACGSIPEGPESNGTGENNSNGGGGDTVLRGHFEVRTLVGNLNTPWDIAFDSGGNLWVAEREGRVSVVDTSTGLVQQVGEIEGVYERGESGLMGLAFHPDFPVVPRVFFSHSFNAGGGSVKNRLVRVDFDGTHFNNQTTLLDNIPGSINHNGSRLAMGPDRFIYMTTGDAEGPSLAIELDSLAGKILRLSLDGTPAPNNPFGSEVYTLGHRNAQGLAFHPETGALFATEHGPSANDEVNHILYGRHYGWPEVHGYCDDNDAPSLAEPQFCRENNVYEPITIWTPTIAPAGATFYNHDAIPGWAGSFLFTTLKGEALYRLSFGSDVGPPVGEQVYFQNEFGRLRDVEVGGRGEIYLATSNRDGRGRIAGPDRILQITYRP